MAIEFIPPQFGGQMGPMSDAPLDRQILAQVDSRRRQFVILIAEGTKGRWLHSGGFLSDEDLLGWWRLPEIIGVK